MALFFDGTLPKWKEEERQSRFQDQINKLINFKNLSLVKSSGAKPKHRHSDRANIVRQIFLEHDIETSPLPQSPPVNPFLVPAVLESLLSSRFRDVTFIVPGEADSFCVHHAGRPGTLILTNDSDLLIYDINPDDRIVMFKDLVLKQNSFSALQYNPRNIAEKVGLESLLPLGFALQQDPYLRTFNKLLEKANEEHRLGNLRYEAFSKRYQGVPFHCSNLGGIPSISAFDPRVAEYVLQILYFAGDDVDSTTFELAKAELAFCDIYLPMLLSDPARFSPWAGSISIRHIGYSLASRVAKISPSTREYLRRSNRVASNELTPLSEENIVTTCKILSSSIRQAHGFFDPSLPFGEPSGIMWRAAGLLLLLSSLHSESRSLPSKKDATILLCADHQQFNWELIHFSAQLQGILYSLRVLKQCVIFYVDGVGQNIGRTEEVLDGVSSLRQLLDGLPSLKDLFPGFLEEENKAMYQEEVYKSTVEKVYHVTVGAGRSANGDVGDGESFEKPKKRCKRRGGKAGETQTKKSEQEGSASNNMYNLLGLE